jgi:SAM-dependent methyltransferase
VRVSPDFVGARAALCFVKLSHKISKLTSGETYRRAGRDARRRLFPIALKPLLARIDPAKLREIQQRYAASPLNYAKYSDVARWLKRHAAKVQDLNLHRTSSPKRILDLGCGGGFFLFIARQFGHSGIGLDVDEFPLFRDLTNLFGVQRVVWAIQPFQPLPGFDQKFDLITAFSTRFNRDPADRNVWGVPEWDFFLDDLSSRLRPNGQVFFEINSGNRSKYYPSEVKDLFQHRGAQLERDYVSLPRGIL